MSSLESVDPGRRPHVGEPKASPASKNSTASPTDGEGASETDLHQPGPQQQHWDDQDRHLDALSDSLNRQHEMTLQMNEELDLHQELLEELDGDVDRTGLRLGGAANQLDRLRTSLKDHGKGRSYRLRTKDHQDALHTYPVCFAAWICIQVPFGS